jgi:hypothetical protein
MPRLAKQRRYLLTLAKTRAIPLLKGHDLTLSRPFEQGCAVQKLINDELLHPLRRFHAGSRARGDATAGDLPS